MALDVVESGQLEVIPGVTKRCSKCGEVKEVGEFIESKKCKYGVTNQCKKCKSIVSKKDYIDNKERRKETSKKWRKQNKEKVLQYHKKYSFLHKKEKSAKDRIRRTAGTVIGIDKNIIKSVISLSELENAQSKRRKIMKENGLRYCKQCEQYYPIETHFTNKRNMLLCDICNKKYWQKAYYERVKEYQRNYMNINKDKIKAKKRDYYLRKKAERPALVNISPEVLK